MKAMEEVGRKFSEKEFFLPQLMASADVVKAVLPSLKEKLPQSREKREKKILFATVQGDIHDIGKNIVVSILESFNFEVIDLGKDVPAETIVSQALKHETDIIGLSTLMTTTIPAMLDTIKLIRQNSQIKSTPIFIGGAVVNKKLADSVNVFYTRDGIEMVKKIKEMNRSEQV
jgi:5-methyltetrahydrofolate--homocysteine methyltransferase